MFLSNQQRQRKKKPGLPKVKSGCLTCKIRKVKCDEEKPVCSRCKRGGYQCDGYTIERREANHLWKNRQLLPAKEYKTLILIQQPLVSSAILRDESEQWYFDRFRGDIVPQLAASFHSPIWDRIVLQLSHQEAFISDLVVAIAALNACLSHQQHEPEIKSSHYAMALQRYGRALRTVQTDLANDRDSFRNALLSCLLVFTFETLHGNLNIAVWQACEGYKLLSQWSKAPKWKISIGGIEDELIHALSRLDLQVMTVVDAKDFSLHQAGKTDGFEIIQNMPHVFADVDEAQLYWELLERRAAHFIHIMSGFVLKQNPKQNISRNRNDAAINFGSSIHMPFTECPLPLEIVKECHTYADEITSWELATRRSQILDGDTKLVGLALYVHAISTRIILRAMTYVDECSIDQHLFDFQDILIMSRKFLRSCPGYPTHSFSIEIGVVPGLYLMVLTCREGDLRRQAIELLRSSRRKEGIWDGLVTAEIGTWIMNLEEEGKVDNFIPEMARVKLSGVYVDLHKKSGKLTCMRRKPCGEGIEHLETCIQWT